MGCFEFWRSPAAQFPRRKKKGKSKCDTDRMMGWVMVVMNRGWGCLVCLYHHGRINKAETFGEIFIALVVSLSWLAWGSRPGPKQEHCSRFAVVGRISLLCWCWCWCWFGRNGAFFPGNEYTANDSDTATTSGQHEMVHLADTPCEICLISVLLLLLLLLLPLPLQVTRWQRWQS